MYWDLCATGISAITWLYPVPKINEIIVRELKKKKKKQQ